MIEIDAPARAFILWKVWATRTLHPTMRRKKSGWSIVLAGFWNRNIFTPEWVSGRLFPEPKIETLVALLPVLPLIYQSDQAAMEVTSTRLSFRPRQLREEASLLRVESMARDVLIALPETPLQAVGVNFSFKEEVPSDSLVEVFNDADDVLLAQRHWSIVERRITRKLTHDDRLLNLAMTYDGEAVTFDFNFHFETTTSLAAQAAVSVGSVPTLKNEALALLDEVYHLGIDNEEDLNE